MSGAGFEGDGDRDIDRDSGQRKSGAKDSPSPCGRGLGGGGRARPAAPSPQPPPARGGGVSNPTLSSNSNSNSNSNSSSDSCLSLRVLSHQPTSSPRRRSDAGPSGAGAGPARDVAVPARPRSALLDERPGGDRDAPAQLDRRRIAVGECRCHAAGDGAGLRDRHRHRNHPRPAVRPDAAAVSRAVALYHRAVRDAEDRAGAVVHHRAGDRDRVRRWRWSPSPCSSWC